MEDVSDSRRLGRDPAGDGDRDGDRGQLILVTGLAVAVTLVAVVLLLNTVIYTQNLATRGDGVDDGEAVSFRHEVADGVGGVVDAENRAEHGDRSLVVENVTDGIARYDALLSRYRAERGTVADVQVDAVSYADGVLLRQTNASRNFTNADGQSVNWTLAEDVSDARRFRLTVSRDELVSEESSPFSVQIDDGTDTWRVYVYENPDGYINVSDGTGDPPGDSCTVAGPAAAIDLTAGTVNGTACPELAYPTEMDGYEISFRNGDAATGTYELTAAAADSAVRTANFATGDDSPRWAYAVYAAEFDILYETPNLAFETALRVAPGEPS